MVGCGNGEGKAGAFKGGKGKNLIEVVLCNCKFFKFFFGILDLELWIKEKAKLERAVVPKFGGRKTTLERW